MTSRILHIRARQFFDPPNMKGGATVLVDTSKDNPFKVVVKVAYCNPVDVFNKKLGREFAATKAGEEIPLRSLPGILGKIQEQVQKRSHVTDYDRVNYDVKIRDFLPKE